MFKIINFGSSSRGNCTLIDDGSTCILIDAGVEYQKVAYNLKQLGYTFNDIQAILITHEHGDHVNEIRNLANRNNINVYLYNELNLKKIEKDRLTCPIKKMQRVYKRLIKHFKPLKSFHIGTLKILPFIVPHDTITGASIGFYITNPLNENLCYITDTGKVEHITLKNIDVLLIESNYDDCIVDYRVSNDMLHPDVAKRLQSKNGHLSLQQTCNFIERHNHKLKQIVILHYSLLNTNFDSLEYEIRKVSNIDNVVFADSEKITIIEFEDKIKPIKLI